jgi:hypothetical protein
VVQIAEKAAPEISNEVFVYFWFFAEPCAGKSGKSQICQKSFGFLQDSHQ